MRRILLYLVILVIAVFMLWATVALATQFLPGFTGSEEFFQSIYVEALSFIVTAAVIGSLSAMLVHYLQEREVRPMRAYVATRATRQTRRLLAALSRILSLGDVDPERYKGTYIAVGDVKLPVYTCYHWSGVQRELKEYDTARDELTALITRHATAFPVAAQDDLITIERQLERVDQCLSVIRAHLPFSPDTEIRIGLESLRRALDTLGVEIKSNSGAEEDSVGLWIATDPPRGFQYSESVDADRSNWRSFFNALKTTFTSYSEEAAKLEDLYDSLIGELEQIQLRCLRAVLFTDTPGGFSIAKHAIKKKFDDLMSDIDFDAVSQEAEERIMARVPVGFFTLTEGLFEAENIAKLPNGFNILRRMEGYVKEEHRDTYEELLARAKAT